MLVLGQIDVQCESYSLSLGVHLLRPLPLALLLAQQWEPWAWRAVVVPPEVEGR